jgi:hypothetical protein
MAARSKKDEKSFLDTVLGALGDASLAAATMGAGPMIKRAINKTSSASPRVSAETLRKTPKLGKDPNTDIMTTTTVQDAQGNSYFVPKDEDRIPDLVGGTAQPTTRSDVREYTINRELDAMPSRLPEIKAERANAEMQRANRRMADETNKSMNAAAAERPKASEKKATKMVNPLDKVQEGLKMEPTIFPKSGSLSDMARAPIPEMMKAPSPKAAEVPSRDFDALFKKATGTSFDPKSRVDRARMAELQGLISSRADLADKSDTKVALAWYASKKK